MVLTPHLSHPQDPQSPEHLQVEQSQGDILVLVRVLLDLEGFVVDCFGLVLRMERLYGTAESR